MRNQNLKMQPEPQFSSRGVPSKFANCKQNFKLLCFFYSWPFVCIDLVFLFPEVRFTLTESVLHGDLHRGGPQPVEATFLPYVSNNVFAFFSFLGEYKRIVQNSIQPISCIQIQ